MPASSTPPASVYMAQSVRFPADYDWDSHPDYGGADERKMFIWYPDDTGGTVRGRAILGVWSTSGAISLGVEGTAGGIARIHTQANWPKDGQWHRLEMLLDRQGDYAQIWLDGAEIGSGTLNLCQGSCPSTQGGAIFGAYFNTGTPVTQSVYYDDLVLGYTRSSSPPPPPPPPSDPDIAAALDALGEAATDTGASLAAISDAIDALPLSASDGFSGTFDGDSDTFDGYNPQTFALVIETSGCASPPYCLRHTLAADTEEQQFSHTLGAGSIPASIGTGPVYVEAKLKYESGYDHDGRDEYSGLREHSMAYAWSQGESQWMSLDLLGGNPAPTLAVSAAGLPQYDSGVAWPTDGQWHTVGVLFDRPSGTVSMRLDGAWVVSGQPFAMCTSCEPLVGFEVGGYIRQGAELEQRFYVDDVRLGSSSAAAPDVSSALLLIEAARSSAGAAILRLDDAESALDPQ